MRGHFLLTVMAVASVLAFGQADANQNNKPAKQSKHETMTGCLTGKIDEYRLKDEKGKTVLLYSNNINLESYVGQSVTVVGDQAATPSTDPGTGRPLPHFKVFEVHPGSGACK